MNRSRSIIFVSVTGMIVRVPASSLSHIGRTMQGVGLLTLKPLGRLIAAARVVESDEADEVVRPAR